MYHLIEEALIWLGLGLLTAAPYCSQWQLESGLG